MDILPAAYDNWPAILKINFMLSIGFILLAITLLGLVLYLRVRKNIRNKGKERLEVALLDFINTYLFDDDFKTGNSLMTFKASYLKNSFDKKIALKQILIFDENLKGESSASLKELFYGLGLYDFLLADLKSTAWFKKARALYVFSQLNIKIPVSLVEPLINAKRNEVRQQAILCLLNSAEENPLNFLTHIERPLTLWQQVYIENALKAYAGVLPDFSKWLNHKISSVVVFCIKMIADHDQYDNILALTNLLHHEEEEIRKQAIIAFRKMDSTKLLPILMNNFLKESQTIKQEILKTIKLVGSEVELIELAQAIKEENNVIQVDYFRLLSHFNCKIPLTRLAS